MDDTTVRIAEFAAGLRYEQLPAPVVAAARTRLVDTIGCALGGLSSPPMAAARRVAVPVAAGAELAGWQLGRAAPDLPADLAAFLNTTMIRYLDFNDWYPGGHPSDTFGALLALAGAPGVTGRRLLTAAVVSYEIFARITAASGLRRRGFDQGFAMGVATAAALGNLLGLDRAAIGAAVGIVAASGVPTRATRSGQLSMWKGCATAYANRNAVFITQLARAGMTGPPAAFEGRNGIHDLVTGPFQLAPFGERYELLRTSLKYWPVCYHAQAAAWAGIALRDRLRDRAAAGDLASIDVGTYWEAWRDTGSEPDKWDPASRETADHSLPYVLAWALTHGTVDARAFEPASYRDPALRPLMKRITVRVDDQVQAAFPETPMLRLTATTHDGRDIPVEVVNPAGHADNPLTEAQVRSKFESLAAPLVGGAGPAGELFTRWWAAATAATPPPMTYSVIQPLAE